MEHKSVLLKEAVDGLNVREGKIYVDATLGLGGHTSEIQKRKKGIEIFAFDQDMTAIDFCKELFKDVDNITVIHSNFENMKQELEKRKITKVDGIIFDLGLSSPQIDKTERGFSFMRNAKLDMRMDQNQNVSAFDIVNGYSLEKLTEIFYLYGEEQYSKSIAKKIIENRPINMTMELVEIIKKSVPTKYFINNHPERKIFQAIRIEVNRELEVLKVALEDAINLLNPEGRISVITFHSLEDRITKQIFNKYSKVDDLVKGLPEIPEDFKPLLKLINKKPILPSEEEINENSRSKSAKLRIVERL